ncbi:MAG: polymer-forming cytoskeletal protein [candidate division NC10 bacterium]|jgi:cytoskeletal protein CcmA (bactofilin family)
MLWNSRRKSNQTGIMAFIGEGSEIEGKYTFKGAGTVLVNGKFHGELTVTDALIVGEKAVIHATIRAQSVVIWGEMVGNVHARERVELRGAARVFGDLEAPVVILEEGVLFEGRCRMAGSRPDDEARDPSVVPFRR